MVQTAVEFNTFIGSQVHTLFRQNFLGRSKLLDCFDFVRQWSVLHIYLLDMITENYTDLRTCDKSQRVEQPYCSEVSSQVGVF